VYELTCITVYIFIKCIYVESYWRNARRRRGRQGRNGFADAAGGYVLPRSDNQLWPSDARLPFVAAADGRRLRYPAFCPSVVHNCYFLNEGRRVDRHPTSQERFRGVTGISDGSQGGGTTTPLRHQTTQELRSRNTDGVIQNRLEVLRTVESRLRSIRREVDEGQRASERVDRRNGEREVESTTVTTWTVTVAETTPLSPCRPADLRDEADDDSSEAGDIELWMSARRLQPERPDEERRPNVVEEL